jgi:hypothetical protein
MFLTKQHQLEIQNILLITLANVVWIKKRQDSRHQGINASHLPHSSAIPHLAKGMHYNCNSTYQYEQATATIHSKNIAKFQYYVSEMIVQADHRYPVALQALTNLGRLSSCRWQSFPTAPHGTGLTCGQHIESHSCIFSFPNQTVTSLFK